LGNCRRRIPLRAAEEARWRQGVYRDALPSWEQLQQRSLKAAKELATGNLKEFLRVVDMFVHGLDQLRMDATVRAITDDWWLDSKLDAKSRGRKNLERLCKSLLRSLGGRKRRQTKAQSHDNKRRSPVFRSASTMPQSDSKWPA